MNINPPLFFGAQGLQGNGGCAGQPGNTVGFVQGSGVAVYVGNGGCAPMSVTAQLYNESAPHFSTHALLQRMQRHDTALHDFITATAKLLELEIQAAVSPHEQTTALRCSGPAIVWRVLSRRWLLDMQWIGDHTGGTEEQWVERFGQLADRIAAEKTALEDAGKPLPPIPPAQPTELALRQAQAALAAQQNAMAQQRSGLMQAAQAMQQSTQYAKYMAQQQMQALGIAVPGTPIK